MILESLTFRKCGPANASASVLNWSTVISWIQPINNLILEYKWFYYIPRVNLATWFILRAITIVQVIELKNKVNDHQGLVAI